MGGRKFVSDPRAIKVRNRGYVPHWEVRDGTYSITFRLYDSLPRAVADELTFERDRINRLLADSPWFERSCALESLHQRLDEALDRGYGACFMRDPRVADIVAAALCHFDHDRYQLCAWCVMPNHVHAIVRPIGEWTVAEILHSWKSYSANRANDLLGRSGSFWQREYFDRLIRDEEDLRRCVEYVVRNPVRARLGDWRWVDAAGWKPADQPPGRRRSD
jgi:REP element-mobilizing transposase RayT